MDVNEAIRLLENRIANSRALLAKLDAVASECDKVLNNIGSISNTTENIIISGNPFGYEDIDYLKSTCTAIKNSAIQTKQKCNDTISQCTSQIENLKSQAR